jgi:Domain of unknown function (DUF6265)
MKNLLVLIALTIFSCKSETKSETQTQNINYDWLVGDWTYTDEMGRYVENWEKKDSTTYIGKAYQALNKDTTFAETMVLDAKQVSIITPGENNNQPVKFQLKKATENSVIWENMSHDFPKRIAYEHTPTDSIIAYIEGDEKENRRIYFKMRRMKK